MKRNLYFLLTFLLLLFPSISNAQEAKVITLKDGSTLKGQVLELNNQTYKVQTENLGVVSIPEADVVSIQAASAVSTDSLAGSGDLKNQVNQLQGQIMADPKIIDEIQKLTQDEEVMKILSDENFIKDVMSYDENKIKNNEKVNELMANPQMKELIEKVNQQLSPQQ